MTATQRYGFKRTLQPQAECGACLIIGACLAFGGFGAAILILAIQLWG